MEWISHSDEETRHFGKQLGEKLALNAVVCLFGELGAGKTTFAKGVAEGAAGITPHLVTSPTFSLLNIYEGKKTVYHFDLYRLKEKEDFLAMGFQDYFFDGGVSVIEWSERIETLLPKNCIRVTLKHHSEGRVIQVV